MSRWREMLMDYGRVFDSEKSGPSAGSGKFSTTSDLKDKRKHDLHLRQTLEVHFRPLFQRFVYGGEKMACHDLRRLLQDSAYRDRLPADKVQELADLADFNRGKAISYNEFANIVLDQLHHDEISSLGSHNGFRSGSPPSGKISCNGEFILRTICRNSAPAEMIEDKMETYQCLPPPFFMILISIAQIVTYVVVNEIESVPYEAFEGVSRGNVIMFDPTRRREVWRWMTYCLLHQGYVDLIFNVFLQLFLGIPLEMMFSWWRMAFVYLVGVVVGSCGHSIADHYVGLVGAAGGSYAIVGAHLMALVMNWRSFNTGRRESVCKKIVCSRILRILILFLLVIAQICLAVYRRWFIDEIAIKIGIAAHIGGIIAGATMGDAFLVDPQRSPLKHGAALIVLFLLLIFVGVTVILNIVWFDYPEQDFSSP